MIEDFGRNSGDQYMRNSSAHKKDINKLEQATRHWKYVAPILVYPKNNANYELLVKRLDQLLNIVGDNENHSLIGLVDIVSNLIAMYEEKNIKKIKGDSIDALKYLMEVHKLSQSDLPEIGSQGVVSEILHRKRALNLRQIKLLSARFNVSPNTFIEEIYGRRVNNEIL